MLRALVVSMSIAALFRSSSAAQAAEEITVESAIPGKPLPKVLLDKHPYVWVADEGCQPLRRPEHDSPVSGAPPLKFMERCGCVAEWQDGPFLLLAKGVPGKTEGPTKFQHIGWVDARSVVKKAEAQKTAFEIYRKAMVVHTVDLIKGRENQKIIEAPVLLGPRNDASAVETFRLFNVYFIWADSDPRSPDLGFFLLGRTPEFNPTSAFTNPAIPRQTVLGWVPKKHVCPWDTREALEWDRLSTLPLDSPEREFHPPSRHSPPQSSPRTIAAKVYATSKDARAALNGGKAEEVFSEVFLNGISLAMPHDRMRFPIVAPLKEDTVMTNSKGGVLRRVGFVGGFVGKDGTTVADAAFLENLQRKLANLREQIRCTEILFVIDDTESMGPHITNAANIMEKIIEKVNEDKDGKAPQVRLGVTFYADVKDTDKATPKELEESIDTSKTLLVDATSKSARDLVARVRDRAFHLRKGYDNREQVFLGIKRGIQEAHFKDQSRKLVVVMGDNGDHADETDKQHRPEAEVVKQLFPDKQVPIEVLAIQVNELDEKDTDAVAFKSQMETILKLSEKEIKDRHIAGARPGKYFPLRTDHAIIVSTIVDRYEQLAKQASTLEQEIASLQLGRWAQIGPALEKILADEGIDLKKLRESNGLQLFSFGYVWEKGPEDIQQVRVKMLASGGELLDLTDILKTLKNEEIQRKPTAENLGRIMVGLRAGEPVNIKDTFTQRESFNSVKLKAKGFDARSPFLNRVLYDKNYGQFDDQESQQDLRDIFKKIMLLEDAKNDRRYKYQQKTIYTENKEELHEWYQSKEFTKEKRGFTLHGDNKSTWFWIDSEEEWP